jgi:chloramphenicol 3-O-phosphotransferase
MSRVGDPRRAIILVTGIQAAGKSTVARALTERFDRGAFIEGDVLWKLIVSGRVDMTPDPSDEALRQLHLRYKHGAMLADSFLEAGFTAVHCDIVVERDLERYVEWVRGRPLYVVVLRPSTSAVAARERARGSSAYRDWMAGSKSLEEAVGEFQRWLDNTPRLGLWIDSSKQSPMETTDEIMRRVWDEGLIG